MNDDAPTLPLVQFSAEPPPEPKPPTSRGITAIFVTLGVLVLAAVVVLVGILVGRSQPAAITTPSASASATTSPRDTTPTAAAPVPTPVASTPPAPVQPPPAFTSLVVDNQNRGCSHGGFRHGVTLADEVEVSWQTTNASSVWIASGTGDASTSGGLQVPDSGNQGDFSHPLTYQCSQGSATYTMTIIGLDGTHVSRSWTVTNHHGHN